MFVWYNGLRFKLYKQKLWRKKSFYETPHYCVYVVYGYVTGGLCLARSYFITFSQSAKPDCYSQNDF